MRLTTLVTLMCIMVSLRVQSGVHATDFLFVHTATGATLNGTLTLTGVAEDVTYFSERPVRIAGHMSIVDFMKLFEPDGSFYDVRTRGSCTACVYIHCYTLDSSP